MFYESNSNSQLHPTAQTEWKYFDAQDPSGWKVISIFYPRIGVNPPTVSTYVNSPDGKESSNHQVGKANVQSGNIEISSQKVEINSLGAVLKLDTSIVKAELTFLPVIRPQYIPINQNAMLWQIEMPRAEVSGQLSQAETSINFSGRGYHDHNWFEVVGQENKMTNRELLPFFLRGWQFGRLFGDKLTIVYGFSPTESHFRMWNGKDLIISDNTSRLLVVGSNSSEKLNVSHPSRFDLTQLGLNAQIELDSILSEKRLSVASDGTQTGYIRASSRVHNDQLGQLEGIHEIWL